MRTLSGFTFSSGGIVDVAADGEVSGTTVSSGGTLAVLSAGLADATTISADGTEIISAHGTDAGAQISGGTQIVDGFASGSTIFTGSQVVDNGGIASATTISGGTEIVSGGGVDHGAIIDNGGSQLVDGVASAATVSTGGSQEVAAGGTADLTVVSSGGVELVDAGGTSINGTIGTSALQTVAGVDSGTVIVGSGAAQTIASGGIANDETVSNGGNQNIDIGGTALGVVVDVGGSQIVLSGAVASGAAINGGTQFVDDGGTADATTIDGGGVEVISSGGIASGITIGFGGTADILNGAEATVAGVINLSGGATLEIGDTSSTLLPNTISGLAGGDVIDLTNVAFVSSGATASFSNGTTFVISVGGNAYDLNIDSGSTLSGASYSVTSDSGSGTVVEVNESIVVSHGQMSFVTPGEVQNGDRVLDGGTLTISAGGVAELTTINNGGRLIIEQAGTEFGGTNLGTVIGSGGVISGTSSETFANSGTVEAAGTDAYLAITGDFNNTGTVLASATEAKAWAEVLMNADGGTISNFGVIKAAGSSSLSEAYVVLSGTVVNGTDGDIAAAYHARVQIDGATITGGTLATASAGEIGVFGGGTATISNAMIAHESVLYDNGSLTIDGGSFGGSDRIEADRGEVTLNSVTFAEDDKLLANATGTLSSTAGA